MNILKVTILLWTCHNRTNNGKVHRLQGSCFLMSNHYLKNCWEMKALLLFIKGIFKFSLLKYIKQKRASLAQNTTEIFEVNEA